MIKLRKFKEEWVDTLKDGLEIFRNPSVMEAMQCSSAKFLRGVIDPQGNLYCVRPYEIHNTMINLLSKNNLIKKRTNDWWINSNSFNDFLAVKKESSSPNAFTLAESYYSMPGIDQMQEEGSVILSKYKRLFEKKNPRYELILKLID